MTSVFSWQNSISLWPASLLSNYQMHNTVLLTTVTILYIPFHAFLLYNGKFVTFDPICLFITHNLHSRALLPPPLATLCPHFCNLLFFIIAFIQLLLAALRLPLVAGSRGYSLSAWCAGFSLWWLLSWRSTGSRARVAHGLSCSMARGIFLDQGSNPCPLHWQADS